MQIHFHGAAGEVGKSCIEIEGADGAQYLMDAGVKFIQGGVAYPEFLENVSKMDAVFLSHAHLDHSGALPFLEHQKLNCPIYTTRMTWQITNMLLEDAYHIAQLEKTHPVYKKRDIRRAARDVKEVEYDRDYRTPDGKVQFRYVNSGHIPGGASILLELEGKRVLYTADMNSEPTRLMVPSRIADQLHGLGVTEDKPLDAMIIETTYGNREHPNRLETEQKFLAAIEAALARGGNVLIPSFGVGRAQEILMMLSGLPAHVPIYLDGMARKVTKLIVAEEDPYVQERTMLAKMMRRVNMVTRPTRPEVLEGTGKVIVATSGMIQGGPSVFYTEQMFKNAEDTIILTGYQVEGTRGRSLWEDHLFYRHGVAHPIMCDVQKFDFSAHYGMSSIHRLITSIPHKRLVLQHGDHGALDAVAAFARENVRSDVFVPHIGDSIELS